MTSTEQHLAGESGETMKQAPSASALEPYAWEDGYGNFIKNKVLDQLPKGCEQLFTIPLYIQPSGKLPCVEPMSRGQFHDKAWAL